jgi:hypothetical protein
MGVHRHRSTPEGALTPICNECGISLCWDISDEEYAEAQPFWNDWICQECNGGTRMSLQDWKRRNPEQVLNRSNSTPVADEEIKAILASLTDADRAALIAAIRNPPPPGEILTALMTRQAPWDDPIAAA